MTLPLPNVLSGIRGAALIVVLAILTVLVILVVGLAALATSERRGSALSSTIATNEALVDLTTNLMLAQLRAATEPPPGATWASQPGMIRIIGGDNELLSAYKLYSSRQMIAAGRTGLDADLAIEENPANWQGRRAIWCDLNAPVTAPDPDGSSATLFPVIDPRALGEVPGFSYDGSTNPVAEIPMPVAWLYVLQNGEVVAPSPLEGNGRQVSVPGASRQNPIIGRIAFWADDESSKVNINTAGYARNDADYSTFWDTPVQRTNYEDEVLSLNQPWTNEFIRYPGHPATTGLNVVFDTLGLSEEQVLALTPFYRPGGTWGGTLGQAVLPTQTQVNTLLKQNPLYASVDELLLAPSASPRPLNEAGLTPEAIERRRFFLTANSRSPETNLFEMPRVTIWPEARNPAHRTAVDALIAFCSTIGNQPFYFVREDQFSTRELDIPQNLKLYNYLQALTGKPFPGFGNGTFAGKYGVNTRNQILTSIFDVVRLANLHDNSNPQKFSQTIKGYAAPTEGPGGTWAPGRSPVLTEVMLHFVRPSDDTTEDDDGIREIDKVKATVHYRLDIPASGMAIPGQSVRIEVSGYSGFAVHSPDWPPDDPGEPQQLFPVDDFVNIQEDTAQNTTFWRRGFGDSRGAPWTISHQRSNDQGQLEGFIPVTGDVVLPYDTDDPASNRSRTFSLAGTTLHVNLYSPADSDDPYKRYEITFPDAIPDATSPDAGILTPLPVPADNAAWEVSVSGSPKRFGNYGSLGVGFFSLGDTMLSMQNQTGDLRWEVTRGGTITFLPHRRYGATDLLGGSARDANVSRIASSSALETGDNEAFKGNLKARLLTNFGGFDYRRIGPLPAHFSHSLQTEFSPFDFSNGYADLPEGGYWPKADEGPNIIVGGNNPNHGQQIPGGASIPRTPYFRTHNTSNDNLDATLATPNRQISSPVIFGGLLAGAPWQTLLFRPDRPYEPFRKSGGSPHPGATSPPDFLLLDLFHMPVVEPYAISEPFSTAGKVNLNSRLMPFGDRIRRETALEAVLRSIRLTAIPENAVEEGAPHHRIDLPTRHPLNIPETLAGFRERFNDPDPLGAGIYRAAAEVCSLDLVPEGIARANLSQFWSNKRVTGDNSLEAPYNLLLPRLTTRTNVFTVHYTVQSLQSTPDPPEGQWDEDQDVILGEQRGSFLVERYIDPNDPEFHTNTHPQYDFAAQADSAIPPTLTRFYKLRVIANHQFRP